MNVKALPKYDEKGVNPGYYPYTGYNTRGLIHEGYFRTLYPGEIYKCGMEILFIRKCKFSNTFMTAIVDKSEISYYFNNQPIYRTWLKNKMGGIIMPLIHSSLYDPIILEIKGLSNEDSTWIHNWNKQNAF